jgi:hypothetical protein
VGSRSHGVLNRAGLALLFTALGRHPEGILVPHPQVRWYGPAAGDLVTNTLYPILACPSTRGWFQRPPVDFLANARAEGRLAGRRRMAHREPPRGLAGRCAPAQQRLDVLPQGLDSLSLSLLDGMGAVAGFEKRLGQAGQIWLELGETAV